MCELFLVIMLFYTTLWASSRQEVILACAVLAYQKQVIAKRSIVRKKIIKSRIKALTVPEAELITAWVHEKGISGDEVSVFLLEQFGITPDIVANATSLDPSLAQSFAPALPLQQKRSVAANSNSSLKKNNRNLAAPNLRERMQELLNNSDLPEHVLRQRMQQLTGIDARRSDVIPDISRASSKAWLCEAYEPKSISKIDHGHQDYRRGKTAVRLGSETTRSSSGAYSVQLAVRQKPPPWYQLTRIDAQRSDVIPNIGHVPSKAKLCEKYEPESKSELAVRYKLTG
jgi:tRNA isopentenyl-2-thiomethyl-A-37 hydroxylase MiaE